VTMWQSFDKNEVSLLILNAIAYMLFFLLPKKFTAQITTIGLLWGLAIGILFDFTIGGGLIDFYKVNDTNHYEGSDVFYYSLFAPFGYFFFYFYETFKIRKSNFNFIAYVLAWAMVGVAAQWLFTYLTIITLQKGYQLAYSFPVFLITQTITGLYIEVVKKQSTGEANYCVVKRKKISKTV